MLLLNNDDVKGLLTMEIAMEALERAYRELAEGEAVCRPRIDIRIPTPDPRRVYQWGTMEGGSTSGYFAIRMKSDVVFEQEYGGTRTQEKYCQEPGLFCGLILLTEIQTGEPVALINDGYLQHMRVGADSGIGVKHLARADARVVGMLGSGGMARSHVAAFRRVREIRRVQVYSPTPEHREEYAREMAARHGIEAVALDHPREVYRGADIVAGCTDAAGPVIVGEWLEPGTHVTCIGGKPDADTVRRIDVSLRLGSAPAPAGHPELGLDDEHIAYLARPDGAAWEGQQAMRGRGHGVIGGQKAVFLADLLAGRAPGRSSPEQITYSERGNIQGAQFFAVAGQVYELARQRGVGRELPTEWFLQDIRD